METKRRPRATPLSPDERRAALVEAVIPLLGQHGRDLTTRQIAEAAGVAEGTIFRAFPDKDSLIDAAIEHALDTTDLIDGLDSLPATATDVDRLDERVRVVVELIRRRLEAVYQVLFAVRHGGPPAFNGRHDRIPRRPGPEQSDHIDAAVAAALRPIAALLPGDLLERARWIRLTTMAATHPMMTNGHPMATDRIVALILTGITGTDAAETDSPC